MISSAAMRPLPSWRSSSFIDTTPLRICASWMRTCACWLGGKASRMRSTVCGALLVCSVENTRCPVSATVITAAETGHLVFSTLHTNSAPQTVDRILDAFPPNQQAQVRIQLAQILKGVVSMKLLERQDGKGRIAALEIMRSSPKISKMIERGETAELHEEVESSVGYYRMQSMNQSLMSLIVHGTLSYETAMRESPDPEDLSLKLRKMFPNLETKGDDSVPSTADFSEIIMLQPYKKLYEEQEEKHRMQLAERDEHSRYLQSQLADREDKLREMGERAEEQRGEAERMRADYKRLKDEAQQKIEKLMERIKELNQRLMGGADPAAKSGMFRS